MQLRINELEISRLGHDIHPVVTGFQELLKQVPIGQLDLMIAILYRILILFNFPPILGLQFLLITKGLLGEHSRHVPVICKLLDLRLRKDRPGKVG